MTYLIICAALLFIIVPIFSVLPSARQKEQMAMRTAARGAGVLVELTSIDDPKPKQDKYISPTGRPLPPVLKVVAYRKQRRREGDWRKLPEVNWCRQRVRGDGWHWLVEPGAVMSRDLVAWLEKETERLPDDVEQVEESGFNITIYWHERTKGSEETVLNYLKTCAELPLYEPGEIDPEEREG